MAKIKVYGKAQNRIALGIIHYTCIYGYASKNNINGIT